MRLIHMLAAAGFAAILAVPACAGAAEVFGSAATATVRSCTEPADQICVIRPASLVLQAGGLNQNVNASFNLGTGSAAQARIDYTSAMLPELHGSSASAPDTRVGSSLVAFRSYTYTGTESIELALSGSLHFVSTGDFVAGDGAGEGELNGFLYLADMDFVTTLGASPTQDNIFNCGISLGCGATILATGGGNSLGLTGDSTVDFDVPTVLITPGEQFIIGAKLQMLSNRGGSIDAMDTFTAAFDLDRTVFADSGLAVGQALLAQDITSDGVPEPAAWALMVAGFGLIGAALRRRPYAATASSLGM